MSTVARISVEQYDQMVNAGVFDGRHHQRVELIHGALREMHAIGPEHEEIVDYLSDWSFTYVPKRQIRVRVQQSVGIPELRSVPEPDIGWVKQRSYAAGRPLPASVLLIVEVAVSILADDRGEKAELYAAASIQDYWIVNIQDRCVEVFRDPEAGCYRSVQVYRAGDDLRPLCLPDVSLSIRDMFATLDAED